MAIEAGRDFAAAARPQRGLLLRLFAGAASSRAAAPASSAGLAQPAGAAAAFSSALARAAAVEAGRGTGFVAFTVAAGAGAACYFSLPAEPPAALLALLLAFSALLAFAAAPGLPRAAALMLAALALGACAGAFETWRMATPMAGAEITTRVTGRLVALEEREGGRARLTIDVTATERPTLRFAPSRIRVTARAMPETLLPGMSVTGVVRLLPATGPVRPGGYDFSFHSYFAGIGASGFFLTPPEEGPKLAAAGLAQDISAAVERFRETLADHIRARIDGPEGEIAAALVAGVRGGITEADNEALRRTGLAHFISISGLHMALVAAIVLVAVRSGLAAFPLFASRHPVKKIAAGAALLAISGYIVISGQEVAAVRSFLMFAVMLVAVLFDRAALTMRNLALSALIILAVAPHEVMGPSFQMSFGATAALIAAYGWQAQRRRAAPAQRRAETGPVIGAGRFLLVFFGGLAATSLIAGFATAVFGVWHFQRVSPLSLAANLAAMPVISAVIMPSAVAGSLLVPLGLDAPFFSAMGWGLRLVMAVAHWFSARSPLDAVGTIPAAALLLLTAALVVATVASTAPLRLLALPLLAGGLLAAAMRDTPDLLVSEDGRLVAMAMADGRLAVNRPRPAAFTLGNWLYATAAAGVARPERRAAHPADNTGGPVATVDAGASTEASAAMPVLPHAVEEHAFRCTAAGLCIARHQSGAAVAHVPAAAMAAGLCAGAAVIVIDDATAANPCIEEGAALVLTKRDLALRGSAALWLGEGAVRPHLAFAIGEQARAWHDQRRFSRAARGLPPYRRQPTGRSGAQGQGAQGQNVGGGTSADAPVADLSGD